MACKRLIKAAHGLLCGVYCHIEQYLQPALFISANCIAGELVFFFIIHKFVLYAAAVCFDFITMTGEAQR